MCAPGRISEILSLPADCEITEKDDKGIERYGLRFFSAKGYAGDIKWIPTVMIPIAQKAIARLKKLSNHARFASRQWKAKALSHPNMHSLPQSLRIFLGMMREKN
jgi:hypothetical protein